ncbi:hypothetical protein VC83_01509 [Pseudogymnoascus destructans]|uniref:Uncharacterized protein n=1 Tax=Pseudogymnoascus destructans TaxID=655981 RepID=A0A177AIW1_9PEZI|nr:uncharacterized protein VC83_01509 [Pseudogymnoascus destructans]OAF62008.1 hypothetical protein VC83_01509 [Pseudogymnoascus destructans]
MGIRCKTRRLVSNTLFSKGPISKAGSCSIEQYAAKKDPFRVGPTGKIPTPWPYGRKVEAFQYRVGLDVYDKALEKRVLNALNKFGIQFSTAGVQNLYQRGFPEAAEDISMQTRDTDTTRWQEAVDYIYEMVKDAAAVRIATAEVGEHKFSDIDDIERPTVIVFVAPGSLAHWAEVEAQIHQTIEAVPFEGDVEIALEILPSFNVPSTGPSTADTPTTRKPIRIPHPALSHSHTGSPAKRFRNGTPLHNASGLDAALCRLPDRYCARLRL